MAQLVTQAAIDAAAGSRWDILPPVLRLRHLGFCLLLPAAGCGAKTGLDAGHESGLTWEGEDVIEQVSPALPAEGSSPEPASPTQAGPSDRLGAPQAPPEQTPPEPAMMPMPPVEPPMIPPPPTLQPMQPDPPPEFELDEECTPDDIRIYLVASEGELFAYNPADGELEARGSLLCEAGGATPFSMAVDRLGQAFVLYQDGNLYRVSTRNGACEATSFEPEQAAFARFGMGFARNLDKGIDELFVTEISFTERSLGLGRIDTDSLELTFIGQHPDGFGNVMEMTGSSDGMLHGFSIDGLGGWVVDIDKSTGAYLQQTYLELSQTPTSLAFAFFDDDYYIFASDVGASSDVFRYRPADGTLSQIDTIGRTIVGSGVSTCKPEL